MVDNSLAFGLDQATLVLQIGSKAYTLASEEQAIYIPGTGSSEKPHFRFRYKEKYEDAIDLGTIQELLSDIKDGLTMTARPPGLDPSIALPVVPDLVQQWSEFILQQLRELPIFHSAIDTVINTNVRIIEIVVQLTPKKENNVEYYEALFRFGVMFTPATPPRLFNIAVRAFGGVFFVKGTVLASLFQ